MRAFFLRETLPATLRSRGVIGALFALVALAAAALGWWRFAAGPSVQTYRVERADLTQTVVASGRVQSPRRVEIGSPVVGIVASVPVAEGQRVKAGQLLVALDDAEARATVEQAHWALAQAEARLAQVRSTALPVATEAARQAELNFNNAERALARQRELFDKGFIGQAALDEAQRARDVAASQLAAARLQRESEGPGGNDELAARAALDQARAAARVAQARLDNMTIEAPVSGVLIARDVEVGAVVQPGKALFALAPDASTELVVQIDEKNLGLLRVGQKALASADAYPERRFDARVAYINPGIDPLRGSVEVRLAVGDPPPELLQDMTVSVDIEVARVKDVLSIPSEALRDGWVLVVRDGHARRQAVKLGVRGQGRVEVADGLAEGDLVLPSSAGALHDGSAVRAAAPANGRRT